MKAREHYARQKAAGTLRAGPRVPAKPAACVDCGCHVLPRRVRCEQCKDRHETEYRRLYRIRTGRRASGCRATPAEIAAVLAANDGTCGCCEKLIPPAVDGRDGRHLDHRHDNGKIRGVLCPGCNQRLATLDLRFTNMQLFERLMRWSDLGADEVP